MVEGIINYSKNKLKIKQIQRRFFIFSLLALVVIFSISFLAVGYHKSVIDQQKSIRGIHKILLKQSSLISQISILGRVVQDDLDIEETLRIRKELRQKVSSLKVSIQSLSNWIFKTDYDSLSSFEDELKAKKIRSKITDYIEHVNVLLNTGSSNKEIRESTKYLSSNTEEGNTAYISEAIKLVDSEYETSIEILDKVGLIIILLFIFEIFLVWTFLFRPLNKTVLEQNNQLLNAAMQVESSARSKTDFLANISHEIRTPMTAILGYADIMKKKENLSQKEIKQSVKIINQNASHLLGLLDEVLDVSKIESGKFTLAPEKVNLSKILNEIYSLLNVKAAEKEIELSFSSDGKIPVYVQVDPKRLKQIIFNIIGNAIKFTQKGFVKLRVEFKNSSKGPQLIFFAEDSGCGIPEEKFSKVFAPFEQANSAADRQYGGTGLGLVLSRKLARMMGGDVILLKSEIDKGSTFQITINPGEISTHSMTEGLSTSTFSEVEAESVFNKESLKYKKILVVDDAKENARLFMMYLKNVGADVKLAHNGEDAVEIATSNQFDLILLDLQMPKMDGFQVLAKLQESGYPGKISALTAHAMQEDILKTKNAGFHGHITKPIDSDKLIETVISLTS